MTSRRVSLLLAAAILGLGAPACDTDDAAERDAKDAQKELDKKAGKNDEKAGEKAEDAAKDVENEVDKGIEDVDGK